MTRELHIEAVTRNGKTFLKSGYCTQPFKIADVTENSQDKKLQLMIMSSSPGVLDGDMYDIKINVAQEANLYVKTQAYQRLFSMKNGAEQKLQISLERGASFCYLPHPSVPQANARFTTNATIYLAEDCTLIWSDIVTCGRKGSGEVFQYDYYKSLTQIFLKGKLVIKENVVLQPTQTRVDGFGQWEGFTHQGTLIFINEKFDVAALSSQISLFLTGEKDLEWGISELSVNGFIVRILGFKAEQIFHCFQHIALTIAEPFLHQKLQHA